MYLWSIAAPYSPYFPHLMGYISHTNSKSGHLLVTSFEDMKSCPAKVIAAIAAFLDIKVTQVDIDEIAAQTSFESMRRNPSTNYEHWDHFGLRHKNETSFYRKGQIGSFKDELSHAANHKLDSWINANRLDNCPEFVYQSGVNEK